MHSERNQERLKTCSALMQGEFTTIEHLDILIGAIRIESPELFHTADTVSTRVFYDRPAGGEPCARYINSNHRYARAYV